MAKRKETDQPSRGQQNAPLALSDDVMDMVTELLFEIALEDGDGAADELGEERPAA
ncbi:hypothetical protein [Sorangium sp. So ce233]|uniref:hypothetical protein n=1 Tax=Sorangium sp. So ce233 TaxID=3133290 RepID=UPI003F64636C